MTYIPKITARIAAIVAGLALVIASFAAPMAQAQSVVAQAQIAALQAQLIALQAQLNILRGGSSSSCGAWSRDLRVGSSGADVTALQNFLIGKGFSINAGATGYFGGQTQAALARYQASVGITPAAGYFGSITRARVGASCAPAPAPVPDDDDDDDEDSDEDRATGAIDEARDALADARDEVEEADDEGEDVDEAEDLLDEAEDLLDEADEAFDDEDFDEAMDLVDEAEERIDEALDESDEDSDVDDDEDSVETSATVTSVDGADNDYATFRIDIELSAFGDDMFISRDADTAFTYQIEDASTGEVVATSDSVNETISSSADVEGGSYVIEEGDSEEFTLRVVFNPSPADEGSNFRLQLLTVVFGDNDGDDDESWSAQPRSKYETEPVYISD